MENLDCGQYPFQPIKFVNLVVSSPCEKEPYKGHIICQLLQSGAPLLGLAKIYILVSNHSASLTKAVFRITEETFFAQTTNLNFLPRSTIKRLSSRVKLDSFKATLLPMSSLSLNLSGFVRAQMVRLLKSAAFCMTRFIALSPVGSPTSDTITIMLFVFFSM